MIGEFNIKNLLLVDYNLNENEHYLEKYKSYFNNLDIKKKLYYKKYYVLNNIIPKLELNPDFLNCSFIDIMCKKFSKKKSGFSGTVNLKLPILYDDKIDNCKYTINENSNNSNNYKKRMEKHFTGKGSMATRKYAPVKIERIIPCYNKTYGLTVERNVTQRYREKYGKNMVRGAGWTNSKTF